MSDESQAMRNAMFDAWKIRAESAEAEVERLRTLLRDWLDAQGDTEFALLADATRAALSQESP